MVALSSEYQKRARWHLFGTGAGIPAGDRARLEEAMNQIPDDTTLGYVVSLVNRCDSAWNDIGNAQGVITVSAETYAGDLNRTVARGQRNSQLVEYYYDIYYRHVDQLARRLWVPDYTTPNSDYYRYARFGGEYVNSLPGTQGAPGDVQYGFAYA
jgi:hypothetical protein